MQELFKSIIHIFQKKTPQLLNIWIEISSPCQYVGKQKKPSPPTYNPFEKPTPFLVHQFWEHA
jgi:hypothetical protein